MIAFLWWAAFVLWLITFVSTWLLVVTDKKPEQPTVLMVTLIGGALALAATWSLV